MGDSNLFGHKTPRGDFYFWSSSHHILAFGSSDQYQLNGQI